ncbi:hypothetical protein ACEPAF_1618 [Sanghuangporus sanghuang]
MCSRAKISSLRSYLVTDSITKYGHFAIRDSGVPNESHDYVTLVLLHGFAWHSGIFSRLLPLVAKFNSRIILVNRRDYPGSDPLDEGEIRSISSIGDATPDANAILDEFMKRQAKELCDFLKTLVQAENIPRTGGLVVAGWSFAAAWVTALLANAADFSINGVQLGAYIRRAVLYDPPYHALGYPPPAKFYNPLSEPSLAAGEGVKLFPTWVSGYYLHGNSPAELEHRIALLEPRPTIETMSKEDIEAALFPPSANPGGSDQILMDTGIRCGLYAALRKAALYPPASPLSSGNPESDWASVTLHYVWCDRSVWEMPWGTWALQSELENAKNVGIYSRRVQFVKLDGANHFAHWDQPERALWAILSDDALPPHL